MTTDKESMLNELKTTLAEDKQVLVESARYGIDPTQQEQNITGLKDIIVALQQDVK